LRLCRVARRQLERPQIRAYERAIMVALTAVTETWRSATLLVKPETVLRWHREGFRLFWRRRSRATKTAARISQETVNLIGRLAATFQTHGATRFSDPWGQEDGLSD